MKFTNEPQVLGDVILATPSNPVILSEICVKDTPKTAYTNALDLAGSVRFQLRATPHQYTIHNFVCCVIEVKINALDNKPHTFRILIDKEQDKERLVKYITVNSLSQGRWHKLYHTGIIGHIGYILSKRISYEFHLRGELVPLRVDEKFSFFAGQRMLAMMEDDQTGDVELVGTDGSIRAHGCILAAASPYMRAAFYGDFKEARERSVTLPDASVAVLKLIKDFAYTGRIGAAFDSTLLEALTFASRILMPDFAKACISSLDDYAPEELWSLLKEAFAYDQEYLCLEMVSRLDLAEVEADEIKSELASSVRKAYNKGAITDKEQKLNDK